jgi:spermidine/putrescine transport system permease protein
MIGNAVQALFTRTNNAPLGAAVSIVTMAIVTAVACLFVLFAGRRTRLSWNPADAAI